MTDHLLYATKGSQPHTFLWRPQKGDSIALNPSDYHPFNQVIRTVHLNDSLDICVSGCMISKPITSLSSLKSQVLRPYNPCKRLRVLWFGAKKEDLDEDTHDWYGNVEFAIPVATLMQRWSNYYLVEIMTAPTHSTTRVLITNADYSSVLPKYDPYTRGGGWYITPEGQHMRLSDCRRYGGGERYNKHGHIVEFMIEVTEIGMKKIVENTVISFKNHEMAVTNGKHVCHRFKGPPNCPTPFPRVCTAKWFFREHARISAHQILSRPKLSPSAEELFKYFLTMEGIPRNILPPPLCPPPNLLPCPRPGLPPCPSLLCDQNFPPLPPPAQSFLISHFLRRKENGKVMKLHQMLGGKQDNMFRLISESISKPKRHLDEEEEEVIMAIMMANRQPPPKFPPPAPQGYIMPPHFGPPPGFRIPPHLMGNPPPPPLHPPPVMFQHSWAPLQPIVYRN